MERAERLMVTEAKALSLTGVLPSHSASSRSTTYGRLLLLLALIRQLRKTILGRISDLEHGGEAECRKIKII